MKYKVENINQRYLAEEKLEKFLEEMDQKGWECIGAYSFHGMPRLIFKEK